MSDINRSVGRDIAIRNYVPVLSGYTWKTRRHRRIGAKTFFKTGCKVFELLNADDVDF